jgi:deoxycytidine triphosphate deaminase
MTLLSNGQLLELLKGKEPPVELIDLSIPLTGDSLIQPASIDLTVGRIFVPPSTGAIENKVIEADGFYVLSQGASALIVTHERLVLPSSIAGIMFPKNGHFALKGILVTNFGHVDPGYTGHLKYTVINFGSEDFRIELGQRIACLLLFSMGVKADPDWEKGKHHSAENYEVHARVLGRDFLDLSNKVASIVDDRIGVAFRRRDQITAFWAPMLVTIAATIALMGAFFLYVNDKIYDVSKIATEARIVASDANAEVKQLRK